MNTESHEPRKAHLIDKPRSGVAWESPSILLGNCRSDKPKPFSYCLRGSLKPLLASEFRKKEGRDNLQT